MSYILEKSTIEQFLNSNFLETLIKYENDEMNDEVNEWIRVSIQNSKAYQASLGSNPLFRYVGIMFIQIFTKLDIGSGRAVEIADVLTQLFRAKRIGDIVFKVPSLQKIGVSNGWYQVNVSVEFFREE